MKVLYQAYNYGKGASLNYKFEYTSQISIDTFNGLNIKYVDNRVHYFKEYLK